ncbi:MAG: sulfurtransferase [Alphaproteobacteria bacterium]|nr:sulfurtransferase [Alphaproteobacteria bacterium]
MSPTLKSTLFNIFLLAFLAALPGFSGATEDWSKLDPGKKTKLELYMTPQQAQDAKLANPGKTLFVDVRTPEELTFVGSATSTDANVPLQLIDTDKWDDKSKQYVMTSNKSFVADVDARLAKKGMAKDDMVILMCRSGHRSANGVNLLAAAGYTNVFNQVEGFEGDKAKDGPTKGQRTLNGWKNAGMPWSYKLDKDVAYIVE